MSTDKAGRHDPRKILLPRQDGLLYLAEGGSETEVMYRHGHTLREFAMFELMDNPAAVADMKDMYRRYLDVAAAHGFAALLAGFDCRASPDWAKKPGYSPEGLREMQHKCIDFLREVARPSAGQLPRIAIAGCVGPRADAYALNRDITAEGAEDYHATQMPTLKECGVDLVWAATINNVPEAVGISRAAAAAARPDSHGINRSHPVEFEPALEPGAWARRIRSLRPNAAKMDKVSLCKLGHIEEGDPEEPGQMMGDLARRYPDVDIWGGCCRTLDRHFDRIVHYVRAARNKTVPA